MKYSILSIFSLLASGALAAPSTLPFVVNTPASATVCQPLLLTWTGGEAPYFPRLYPGGDPEGSPLKNFGALLGNSLTWKANTKAGTSIEIAVTDSTGAIARSAPFTIEAGSDTSCIS